MPLKPHSIITIEAIGNRSVTFLIPSRRRDKIPLDPGLVQRQKAKVQDVFQNTFSGVSPETPPRLGIWRHEDGSVTREEIVIVESSCSAEKLTDAAIRRRITDLAVQVCLDMDQDCVFVSWGGDGLLVSETGADRQAAVVRFNQLPLESRARTVCFSWIGIRTPEHILQVLSLDGWTNPEQPVSVGDCRLLGLHFGDVKLKRVWLEPGPKHAWAKKVPQSGDLMISAGENGTDVRLFWEGRFHGPKRFYYSDAGPNRATADLLQEILGEELPDLVQDLDRKDGFGFVVLDEAHCFWLWGNEFRPDYFHTVGLLRKDFGGADTRFLLFSATVTESVLTKVREKFGRTEDELIASPPDRLLPVRDFLRLKPSKLDPYGARSSPGRLKERANRIRDELRVIGPQNSLTLVFVPMRWQADDGVEHLKPLGLKASGGEWNIKSFHAGLSTRERAEIYDDLKAPRKIDLMVTTKAFGMGMDIDDIHLCYHLSPPCYLEDYLQEVGRCGRNKQKLEDSGHSTVECHVFWNNEDLGRNTSLVQRSSVSFEYILTVFQQIKDDVRLASTGKRVAIVCPSAVDPDGKTRIRIALGWLERAPLERIKILENLPEILELQVKDGITEVVRDKGINVSDEVISILQRILDQDNEQQENSHHGDDARFVGLLLSKDEEKDNKGYRRILLSMHAVFREAGFSSLDDAYHVLGKLVRQKCVVIERELDFSKIPEAKKGRELLKTGQEQVLQLSKIKSSFSKTIKELSAEFENRLNGEFENEEAKVCAKRLAWAVIRTAKYAGIRVKEEHNEQKEVVFKFERISGTSTAESSAWNSIWDAASKLFDQFEACDESRKISLDKIVGILADKGISRTSVKLGILVLGILKVVHLSSELFTEAYLVEIVDKGEEGDSLVDDQEEPIGSKDDARSPAGVKREIDENNEFNRLRGISMQLFLQIPDEDERTDFLKDYFCAADANFLVQNVLEKHLTELEKKLDGKYKDDPEREQNDFIKKIKEQIYRTTIDAGFEKLKNPASPNQIKVCEAKVDQNLLVNAGPGSGKTLVLIWRVVNLIYEQNVRPEDILILAFNRAVVSEIKSRIRDIFGEIGLDSYVERLQVHTFHSYARKQMKVEWLKHRGLKNHHDSFMRKFINEIRQDSAQGSPGVLGTSKNLRTVLVDEFQDMNEDFFFLLKRLKDISGATIMAIGDDDQDIGRWNRNPNGKGIKPFANEYFERFRSELCVGQNIEPFDLLANFRSARKIVDESQGLLAGLTGGRVKTSELKPVPDKNGIIVEGEVSGFTTFDEGLTIACDVAMAVREGVKSCAVLCRTNAEALETFVKLKKKLGNSVQIQLQAGADLEVKRLRHIAAFLESFNASGDFDSKRLDSKETKMEMKNTWKNLEIPEATMTKEDLPPVSLGSLMKSFLKGTPHATVKDWLDWLDYLNVTDAERLIYDIKRESKIGGHIILIVSTIHRVKGLEYDSVIIMPSRAEFPFNDKLENVRGEILDRSQSDERIDLAKRDEIYLYYVAMTRAKKTLWKGWGDRENAFYKGEKYSIELTGRVEVLAGLLSEVMISQPSTYGKSDKPDRVLKVQDLIAKIRVDSPLRFSRKDREMQISIMCNRTQVGLLSKWATKKLTDAYSEDVITELKVKVAAICRWPIDPEWNHSLDSGKAWVTPPEILETQKWFYTLLVTAMPKEFE